MYLYASIYFSHDMLCLLDMIVIYSQAGHVFLCAINRLAEVCYLFPHTTFQPCAQPRGICASQGTKTPNGLFVLSARKRVLTQSRKSIRADCQCVASHIKPRTAMNGVTAVVHVP